MNPEPLSAQAPVETSTLTIGDLAQRTGVAPATLRVWESRHGFPRPRRRDSGHRRYDEHDVELVTQVLRRRDSGMRLEVAIAGVALADAATGTPPGAPSVYAAMRRLHPNLQPQRLKKSTLIALSWAIEDECCSRAEQPMIFGGFQKEQLLPRRRGALDRAGPDRPVHDGVRGVLPGARPGRPHDDGGPARRTRRCGASGRWSATPRTTRRC